MSLFNRIFGSRKSIDLAPRDSSESRSLPLEEPTRIAGGGSTPETAVKVDSIAAEYQWLKANCPGYRPGGQALVQMNDKRYDRLTLRDADGHERTVYFDISSFFGR